MTATERGRQTAPQHLDGPGARPRTAHGGGPGGTKPGNTERDGANSADVAERRDADRPEPDDTGRDSEYAHLMPLFEKLASLPAGHPDREAVRAELVTGHLPVVAHIARRFSGRGEPTDDLEQAGTVGLINAVDRFQPDRGVDFLSYAIPTITGEVRRHFRDRTWAMRVPRRLKEMQGAINGAIGPLSQELGRAPRPSEIADRLGLATEEVLEGLDAQQAYRGPSLDEMVAGADSPLSDTLGEADAELDKVEYRQTLAPLLDELPARERTILVLRFFGNKTQTQIADQIGISQMHVSRLLARTLARLRARMTED